MGSKESVRSIVDKNATNEGQNGVQHTVILDPTEVGFDFVDWANWTRFRAAGLFEDDGGGVEVPEDCGRQTTQYVI